MTFRLRQRERARRRRTSARWRPSVADRSVCWTSSALSRAGLRRMYIGTLTLSLFLAVFGAVLLAVVLGKQLATPLLMLADGVRQVAAGDLRPKVVLPGRDELVGLTRSFADMTQQLADARAAVDSSMREVDAARANLQTILDNLTPGHMARLHCHPQHAAGGQHGPAAGGAVRTRGLCQRCAAPVRRVRR